MNICSLCIHISNAKRQLSKLVIQIEEDEVGFSVHYYCVLCVCADGS